MKTIASPDRQQAGRGDAGNDLHAG